MSKTIRRNDWVYDIHEAGAVLEGYNFVGLISPPHTLYDWSEDGQFSRGVREPQEPVTVPQGWTGLTINEKKTRKRMEVAAEWDYRNEGIFRYRPIKWGESSDGNYNKVHGFTEVETSWDSIMKGHREQYQHYKKVGLRDLTEEERDMLNDMKDGISADDVVEQRTNAKRKLLEAIERRRS